MTKRVFDTGVVSWRMFDALFENQCDLLRKLRFLTGAGSQSKEEGVVLDLIADLLRQKERELQELRAAAWSERQDAGGPVVEVTSADAKVGTDEVPLSPEDRALCGKLAEIRRTGGYPWENLEALIEGTYLSLGRSREASQSNGTDG